VSLTIACRVILGILCLMTEMTGTEAPAPWIPRDTDFASRLALVRHHMGWNVKQAAQECGVPPATWRLWEVDGALPRNLVTICMAIAARTGCDLDWLVYGPSRGGMTLTGRYGRQGRVVATMRMSAPDPAERQTSTSPATTRPVTQTRPVPGSIARLSDQSSRELVNVGRL